MTTRRHGSLIDTHAHLTDKAFSSDLSQVIQRAYEAGVEKIITVADSEQAWQETIASARNQEHMYAAIGVHPHDADRYGSSERLTVFKKKLTQTASANRITAIGETGLDYYKGYSDPLNQKNLFSAHLTVARELSLPLIIHCRQAYDDLIALLKDFIPTFTGRSLPGVVHCFSGTLTDAEALCAMGFFLGIDGPITYPKSPVLKNVVKNIPLKALIVETDCPYLAPQCFRGKRNEPSYLPYIAAEVAQIKKIPLETVCTATTANARKLFRI